MKLGTKALTQLKHMAQAADRTSSEAAKMMQKASSLKKMFNEHLEAHLESIGFDGGVKEAKINWETGEVSKLVAASQDEKGYDEPTKMEEDKGDA